MKHFRIPPVIVFCLLLCALLTACGQKNPYAGITELQTVFEEADLAELENYTDLMSIDFRGSADTDAVIAWKNAHPDIAVLYDIALPDGTRVDPGITELDLSEISPAELNDYVDVLAYLPAVEHIDLGSESEKHRLSFEDIAALQEAHPEIDLDYSFERFGVPLTLKDEQISFSHIKMDDEGETVREFIGCMKNCSYLDMDFCGVSNEAMAQIRDENPDMKVVWRVWFGTNYSVRTDVDKILASQPTKGGDLTPSSTAGLYYCTDIEYLDIGHNPGIGNIDFVKNMPKLKVLVMSMTGMSDLSALAECENLEYLEAFTNQISDLSPLSGLKNLKHLNVQNNQLSDISPVYGLDLIRFSIGCMHAVPLEQRNEYRELHPDCDFNDISGYSELGTWKYDGYDEVTQRVTLSPYFEPVCKKFGYETLDYSFTWLDPLYDAPEDNK